MIEFSWNCVGRVCIEALSPNCEGIPAGRPMSPGVENNDEEVPADGPMSPGV